MNERSNAATATIARSCSHCSGSGREPAPLVLDFSRAGERRGELMRLVERTGLHQSTLSRMLSGSHVPTLPNVVLVAHALGVTETALIHSPPVWHRLLQELGE